MTDQRLAADERNVKRLVFAHEREDAIYERVTVEVAELAESDSAAQVLVTIGIAPGTAERALASDFDGEQGNSAGEDASPGGEQLAWAKAWIGNWRRRSHNSWMHASL
jgi:hypothetical protein